MSILTEGNKEKRPSVIDLTYEDWLEKYEPVENPFRTDAPFDGTMFETYEKELSFIQNSNNHMVWTLVDGDGGSYIINGIHLVNRLGYFITAKAWEGKDIIQITIEDGDEEEDATN